MKDEIWLRLRRSRTIRRMQAMPGMGSLIAKLSWSLVPYYRPRVVRVRGGLGEGLLLRINPRWGLPLWEGTYEQAVQDVLAKLLGPGKVFYDVGGGIGFFSLIAARLGATAICFEPDKTNASFVETHMALNALESKVELVRKAVFSRTGCVAFGNSSPERGYGNGYVQEVHVDRSARWVTGEDLSERTPKSALCTDVPCVKLDDFVAGRALPDVIKIDVEGAESDILKGAGKLLNQARPHLICELHDAANSEFVQAQLRSKGYGLTWLETGDCFTKTVLASPTSIC